jgi:hypothetical protein
MCENCHEYRETAKQMGQQDHIYVSGCKKKSFSIVEAPLKNLVTDRLALMLTINAIPNYMFQCKLAALSKTSSTIIRQQTDIRPIGILPTLWKVMERSIKNVIEEISPKTINIGHEQAGFTARRSTLDHTVNVIQRLNHQHLSKGEKRIYAFMDITAAFDSVKHDRLIKILAKHLSTNIKPN